MSSDKSSGNSLDTDRWLAEHHLIELLCRKYEALLENGTPFGIGQFLARHAGEFQHELFYQLLVVELAFRVDNGPAPDLADYLRQFGDRADQVGKAFETVVSWGLIPPHNKLAETVREAAEKARDRIGDYLLKAEIGKGEGALAKVYVAVDLAGREVAIKISDRPSVEGDRLKRLNHPHIVKLYHCSQLQGEPVRHLVCMEYIKSISLKAAMESLPAEYTQRSGAVLMQLLTARVHQDAYSPLIAQMDWPTFVAWLVGVGQEFRCNVTFVETKLLVYLEGLEKALQAKHDEIKAKGGLSGIDAKSIIQQIIADQKRIMPHVCHVLPDTRRIRYESRGGHVRLTDEKTEAVIIGYALMQPKQEFEFFLCQTGGAKRPVEFANDIFTISNSSKIMVALDKLADHVRPGDTELELRWKGTQLASVGLNVVELPQSTTKQQKVVAEFLAGKLGELIGLWPLKPNGKKMDVEMYSTKNNAMAQCTSRFEIVRDGTRESLALVVRFFCQEQGGDWTCFEGEASKIVFTAAPNEKIVRVLEGSKPFDTEMQLIKRRPIVVQGTGPVGNLWGWRPFPDGTPLSYWKNLEVQVDNEWKTTSSAIVGIRGSIEFTVELEAPRS